MRTSLLMTVRSFYRKSKQQKKRQAWKTHHIPNGCGASGIVNIPNWTSIKKKVRSQAYLAIFQKGLEDSARAILVGTTRTMTQFFSQMMVVEAALEETRCDGVS